MPPVPRLRNPQIAAWLEIVLANKPGNGRTIAFPIEYDELAVTAYLARNRDPDVAIIGVVSEQRVKRLARRNAQRMKERPVKTDPTELVHEDERLRQRLVTRINLERHAYDLRFYYEYTTEGAICITYNVTPQLAPNGLTVAELFAGGGLMAVGLRAAGYDLVWANDFDRNAVKAYRHNLGDHIVHGDITTIDPADIPDTDVIAGGPPCQDYSVAGTGAGENGERGKLVWAYLRIIEAKRPKAFIFENVKGLITKKHRPTFDALLAKFEEIGYNVNWRLINAWDYGVAQKRERVFIVGIRKDLGFAFEFPEPSPEDYRTQVLRDVIGDLPEPVDTCGHNVKKAERVADMNEPGPTVTTQFRCQTVEITNHNPQPLSEKAMEYLQRDPRHLQKHRPPTVDEPSPTLPAVLHKGVPYGLFYPNHGPGSFWTPKSEYTYDQANRVQSMDAPCNTIPAHHNSGQPIHPTQAPRRFTVRECLRIQSVPDWYVLPDDLSLSAQYRIVGNGVASRVAYLLGIALAEQLRAVTESSVIGERLIPGTPDGRGTANSRKEAV